MPRAGRGPGGTPRRPRGAGGRAGCEHLVVVIGPVRPPGPPPRRPLGGDLPLKAGLLTSLGFGHVSGLIAVAHPEAFHRAVAAEYGQDESERIREAGLRRERSGAHRLTDAIYGGEALYARPEARRLGEGSADEVKEREAAMLLDPAALIDADGVLAASDWV